MANQAGLYGTYNGDTYRPRVVHEMARAAQTRSSTPWSLVPYSSTSTQVCVGYVAIPIEGHRIVSELCYSIRDSDRTHSLTRSMAAMVSVY
jgi:hypothetical protein